MAQVCFVDSCLSSVCLVYKPLQIAIWLCPICLPPWAFVAASSRRSSTRCFVSGPWTFSWTSSCRRLKGGLTCPRSNVTGFACRDTSAMSFIYAWFSFMPFVPYMGICAPDISLDLAQDLLAQWALRWGVPQVDQGGRRFFSDSWSLRGSRSLPGTSGGAGGHDRGSQVHSWHAGLQAAARQRRTAAGLCNDWMQPWQVGLSTQPDSNRLSFCCQGYGGPARLWRVVPGY